MTATTIQTAARENEFCMKMHNLTSKICSDQTDLFLVILSRDNKYIMIIYNHNSNTIIARALKMKSVLEIQ